MHFAVFLFLRAVIVLTRSEHPLLRFSLLQGLASSRFAQPPFAERLIRTFRALQHHQIRRLLPRSSTLEYRPRPRFRTVIAAILPTNPFQAYFIPESAHGLSLQGFLLRCWADRFPINFPSCRSRWPLASQGFLGFQLQGLGRLQGIARQPSSFTSQERVSTTCAADPLLGFFPP